MRVAKQKPANERAFSGRRAPQSAPAASPSLARGVNPAISVAVAAAIAGLGAPAMPAASAEADKSSQEPLEVIIVTARKVSENLQDVPLSIDVLSKKDLAQLDIEGFDDYAQRVPSVSFISAGPGTQLLVVRGVADGSNPTYSTSSATGLFVDDMSTSWFGTQPDLHLYDIERIEVLNGPQGTTFGAGAMAGAVRYVTNKPDLNAFSAGLDFSGGSISDGRQNFTYEGFLNAPLIPGKLGLRISAFSDSHGGFINNQLTTRVWKNTAVSNNAPWARSDYNREYTNGGRIALRADFNDKWSSTLTYGFQRQNAVGAWDQDPNLAPRTVARFGPESNRFEAKMADLHVDGDLGIADLVFASTYWSLPRRQMNEYSQYIENFAGGANEGVTCANDPVYGGGPYTDCAVPIQYYEYHTNPERWSNELRLASKAGGKVHWLVGVYNEKTRDKNSGSTYYMPGLRTDSPAFQYYNAYSGTAPGFTSLPPGVWYGYQTRTDYLQTTEFANINFDVTGKLNLEAGAVHFKSNSRYYTPYGQFAYSDTSESLNASASDKWNGKLGASYHFSNRLMMYFNFAQGFRDGGTNAGYPPSCYANGVPNSYVPDTLNNYELGWKSTLLDGRMTWNGAAYLMRWKQLQTLIYNAETCATSSFGVNIGDARIEGMESNVDYKLDEHWSLQAAASYTDSHIVSSPYPAFQPNVGERLPFVPYFNWSWNLRYQQHFGANMLAYVQVDMAHKGDMWNDVRVEGSNGFPRILQPGYNVANLRLGLNPVDSRWLAELFVTNIADTNAIVYSNTFNFDLRETTNEPRVVGLRLNYRFGKISGAE